MYWTAMMEGGAATAIYLILLTGILLIFGTDIRGLFQKWRLRNRLTARKKEIKKEEGLYRHLRLVLSASLKRKIEPGEFLLGTALLFLLVFLTGLRSSGIPVSMLTAGVSACIPYLLLRIRLESLRNKGSHEGERLVSELLRQYRISGMNISEAMEKTVACGREVEVSGRLLFRFLMEMRSTGSRLMIRAAAERFSYGIHTNWSRMLARDIELSAVCGTNVSLALEDILIQMREARAAAEERKRMNGEAVRMTLFLVPLLYAGTVFLSVHYMEISLMRFLQHQFYTPEGFALFLIALFLFLFNLAVIEIVNNQRFDY